ncbi:MAG: hypothetical protein JW395_2868 [Nitrospira sp.]|nr:hypothetical protein [Nitrospira sp.]
MILCSAVLLSLACSHCCESVLKHAPQSGVTVKKIREPNGLSNERLNHVLKATKNAQAPKVVDVIALNPDHAGWVQPNDSEVE